LVGRAEVVVLEAVLFLVDDPPTSKVKEALDVELSEEVLEVSLDVLLERLVAVEVCDGTVTVEDRERYVTPVGKASSPVSVPPVVVVPLMVTWATAALAASSNAGQVW